MNNDFFSQMDFGPLEQYLLDDDITDISYSNGGNIWLRSLTKGIYRVENSEINNCAFDKLVFCAQKLKDGL